jgi:DNA-binding transcriptional ArsR family regulator
MPDRRRVFARGKAAHPLTPIKLSILKWIGHLGISTTEHHCRLLALSDQAARKHLRDLYDMGLADRTGISRVHMAGPDVPNDPSLLYGHPTVIHLLTKEGRETVQEHGLEPEQLSAIPKVGPKNPFKVVHELSVRDVRVWLNLNETSYGDQVRGWYCGAAAVIGLGRKQPPYEVRPDAVFTYEGKNQTLYGLLEVDRGTESKRVWEEKLAAYHYLLSERMGTIVITVPTYARLTELATWTAPLFQQYSALANRVFVTEHKNMRFGSVYARCWNRPGSSSYEPLMPPTPNISVIL